MRSKIGIDMDDTLYSFIRPLLLLHNTKYKKQVIEKEITDYQIHQFLDPKCKNIFNDFVNPSFFEKINIPNKNIDVVNKLHTSNDIYFVTSGHPKTAPARHKLLKKYFSWYSAKNLIITGNKSLLMLDYLLDDCPYNINKDTFYKGVLRDKPWNKKYKYDGLVNVIDIGYFAFKLKYGMV